MIKYLFVFVLLISFLLSGCSPQDESPPVADEGERGSANPMVVLNEDKGNEPMQINDEPELPFAGVMGYEDISVETLVDMMMTRRETFLLINTLDFQLANLPDTDLMISYDRIVTSLDQLPAHRNAEIVLYCRSGNKSGLAAAELAQAGYTNVKNLVGGMVRWHNLGLPLLLPE